MGAAITHMIRMGQTYFLNIMDYSWPLFLLFSVFYKTTKQLLLKNSIRNVHVESNLGLGFEPMTT